MKQVLLLLASCALATSAHASYGQMRLEGLAILLGFWLTVGWVVLVNLALAARLFRHRFGLVVGTVVGLPLAVLMLALAATSSERAVFIKMFSGGSGPLVLLVTGAVFLPFIVIAPFAQYLAMREGRGWPRWISAWIALQVAVLPGFVVLEVTDKHYWERERAEAQALGSRVEAGGFGALLERAERRKERIWGTAWHYPWRADGTSSSGWPLGLMLGVDASAPIAANEPLGEADRTALQTLMERHLWGYAGLQARTKLIWDALEPGSFSRQLAPAGVHDVGVVSEELIPVLLERLEKHGDGRVCPGGRMMDADRAVLNALVADKLQLYEEARKRDLAAEVEEKKVELEMSEAPFPYGLIWKATQALGNSYGWGDVSPPDWSGFPQRIERLCPGPPSAGSDPPAAG